MSQKDSFSHRLFDLAGLDSYESLKEFSYRKNRNYVPQVALGVNPKLYLAIVTAIPNWVLLILVAHIRSVYFIKLESALRISIKKV